MYSDETDNENEYDREYEYDSEYDYSNFDEMSIADSIEVRSKSKMRGVKSNHAMDMSRTLDPGYHIVKRSINGVKRKVEFYHTTNIPGRMIRNAITGIRYNEYHVGFYDEDIFFKVNYAVGEKNRREITVLFYDSPEEFEKHFGCTVSLETKEKWRNKCDLELFRRSKKEKTI
jgi:hypothetical protein